MRSSSHRQEDDGKHRRAQAEKQDVGAQQAGLQAADEAAGVERGFAEIRAAREHDGLLEVATQLRSEDRRGPIEERVVQLVEVELVLEYPLERGEARHLCDAAPVE